MPIAFSPATTTFHDDTLAPLPDDAVAISTRLHETLLAARSKGELIVMGSKGLPIAVAPPRAPVEDLRADAVAAVKRVASVRILAASPLWRQINDARDLPSAEGGTRAAIEARFAVIDTIRRQSDALEASIAKMGVRALAAFDPNAPDHWTA